METQLLQYMVNKCVVLLCDQVVDLTEPLVQFIKSGSTKPALRVDAIYSFLLVSKIAAVHSKASRCLPHRSVSFLCLPALCDLLYSAEATQVG